MGRGSSGRIVIEVAPDFKRRLHSRLAAEGRTLKEWFVEQAEAYLARLAPQQLPLGIEPPMARPVETPTATSPGPRQPTRHRPKRRARARRNK